MKVPAPPTAEWSATDTALGLEIVYRPQKSSGFYAALIVTVLFGLACVYVTYFFVANWLSGAEILPAGVVLCALALGGCWLALKGIRWLFRTTTYSLRGSSFYASRRVGAKVDETVIEKAYLIAVSKVYTPPKSGSRKDPGTWRSALVYRSTDGSEKRFYLEGASEEETAWLSGLVSEWSGVRVMSENTAH